MKNRIAASIVSMCSAAALAVSVSITPTPAIAGGKKAAIGFGVGVLVGIGVSKALSKKRKRKSARSYKKKRHSNRVARSNAANNQAVASRAETRQIQTALAELGYYTKKIDGIGGRGTRRAVSLFQRDQGFRQTGRLNDDQKKALFASAGVILDDTNSPTYSNNSRVLASTNNEAEEDIFGNTVTAASGDQPGAELPVQQADTGTVYQPASSETEAVSVDDGELASIFDEDNSDTSITTAESAPLIKEE